MAVEILPLHLATVTFPEQSPLAHREGRIFAFALVHPDGVLLFETGLGSGNARVEELLRPRRRSLPAALGEQGLGLRDVVAVANSHLHIDHCGQNHLFGDLPIYVQRSEYEAAHTPHYTVLGWVDFPGASYELLEGEAELVEGIRLLPTPGHTPGHQSLAVETEEELVILAGQAIYTAAEWEGATNPQDSGAESSWDRDSYDASARYLRNLDPRRVFFSHDERIWQATD
jgi:N-acyl homoserine lactone hydrolase